MARATADIVHKVIRSQEIDAIAAYDLSTGAKLDYNTGSADDLCAAVDLMEVSFLQPYRLDAWSTKMETKRGNRAAADKPFSWVMVGRSGGASQPAPERSRPEPVQAAPMDINAIRSAVRAESEVEYLRREFERLQDEISELNDELDERAAEPVQAAPVALKWYETAEGVKAVTSELRPLLSDLFLGIGSKRNGAGNGQKAVEVAKDDVTDDERKLVAAVRAWKKEDPEQANGALDQLLGKFGTDGSAAEGDQP